jgi:hypothetical protein
VLCDIAIADHRLHHLEHVLNLHPLSVCMNFDYSALEAALGSLQGIIVAQQNNRH